MSRPVTTIELTSKPLKAWLALSELGILVGLIILVRGFILVSPHKMAFGLGFAGVAFASRVLARACRWWEHG